MHSVVIVSVVLAQDAAKRRVAALVAALRGLRTIQSAMQEFEGGRSNHGRKPCFRALYPCTLGPNALQEDSSAVPLMRGSLGDGGGGELRPVWLQIRLSLSSACDRGSLGPHFI